VIGRVAGGLAVAGAACIGYGALIENRSFHVRRFQVPVLPPKSRKLRVLHVSDVHLGARNRARAEFLSRLAGLEPDLVVSTGDHISEPAGIELLAESLGRLLDRPGVYVTSSNDYTGPSLNNPLAYLWRTTANHGHDTTEQPLPTDSAGRCWSCTACRSRSAGRTTPISTSTTTRPWPDGRRPAPTWRSASRMRPTDGCWTG
jgi:predicted MPP superfamily phosphohydrolase